MAFSDDQRNRLSLVVTNDARAVAPKPVLFHPGNRHSSEARWGDYSATSLDPVDGVTFWTVQQYAGPNGEFDFSGTIPPAPGRD